VSSRVGGGKRLIPPAEWIIVGNPTHIWSVVTPMSRLPDEPQSWSSEPEGDALLGDLRHQLEAVKARLTEHRLQMQAAGLGPPAEADDPQPQG
jgi:hypothetical protein